MNRPELTAEKFVADTISGKGTMYRTGDIGRKNENGYFDFVGRIDFQVKLRGLRIEIGEIEHALLQLNDVAECVTLMTKDNRGDDSLTAYLRLHNSEMAPEVEYSLVSKTQKQQWWGELRQWLPGYMLPANFIVYKSFPLTTHEKIDRNALVKPSELINNDDETELVIQNLEYTETQLRTTKLWEEVLGLHTIGLDDDFMESGGHSLKVIQLITLIIREFGIEVPMIEFYEGVTIKSLSEKIDNQQYNKINLQAFRSPKSDVHQNVFPITDVQSELWILNNLDKTGLSHNIQIEYSLKGEPDIERFKRSVVETIRNEEMFRSTFGIIGEHPMQFLHEDILVEIPERDLSELSEKEKTNAYNKIVFSNGNIRFDLEQLPLFSFVLVHWSSNEYRLLMCVHHLIFDGWSLYLFMQRISNYYLTAKLEKVSYRNADYALQLRNPLLKNTIEKELDYWKNTLKNIPEQLTITQKPSDDFINETHEGERHWWTLNETISSKIEQLALILRTTPYTVFMSAYQLALSAAANQHDIVVGSPYANRNNNLINNLIGYYTNMICIRSNWNTTDSVSTVLQNCNTQVINAFSNSTVSYGEIAKQLNKSAGIAYNSVFHAIFVLQNWPHQTEELPGFIFTQREVGNNTSKTTFLLNIEKTDNKFVCWLEYDTNRFSAVFTAQLANAITQTVQLITDKPDISVKHILEEIRPLFKAPAAKKCYVAGDGNLADHCIGLIQNSGIDVVRVISDDENILQRHNSISLPANRLSTDLKTLPQVDYIFSINNGLILKPDFLALAVECAVNYHDAPLPRYAGMHATNHAILNGETMHGICWHNITDQIDAGDILESEQIQLSPDETSFSLNTACFEAAIRSFNRFLQSISEGNIKAIPQQLSERTYFGLSDRPRKFGCLSPDDSALQTGRLLRATQVGMHLPNEFLMPVMYVNNQFYNVPKAKVIQNAFGKKGTVDRVNGKHGFYCIDGFIVPEVLYNKHGIQLNPEALLCEGSTIVEPGEQLCDTVAAFFKRNMKHEKFWLNQLLQVEYTAWPYLAGNSEKDAKLEFDTETLRKLNGIVPGFETNDVLKSLFCIYLMRCNDTDSCSFGLESATDKQFQILKTSGFINDIVPLNIRIDSEKSIREAVSEILEFSVELFKKQTFTRSIFYRYPELANKAPISPEIVFTDQNSQPDVSEKLLVTITNTFINLRTTKVSGYKGLTEALRNFSRFLEIVTEDFQLACKNLALLNEKQINESLSRLNKTCAEPVQMENIVCKFNEIVQKFPENIAIFDQGESYNYRIFAESINSLSVSLKNAGVKANTVVAITLERSYSYFVALMAVLNQGGTFLTIDTKLPEERQKFILENAGVELLLITSNIQTVEIGLPVLHIPTEINKNQIAENHNLIYNADNIAYIIYTSGSTGVPKGVKISNRNLTNFISGAINLYEITNHDRILQFSTLSFDAAIEEIFCSFCTGAGLFLRTDDMLNPEELLTFADVNKITVLDLPTSFWRQLIRNENTTLFQSIRLVIVGGEALTKQDVSFWKKTQQQYCLMNTYGPTETTVVALAANITNDFSNVNSVPIGRPLPGYRAFVTNKQKQILPLGLAGELLISGESVTPGYTDEQNNRSFTILKTTASDERCYCTGDRVYADENGTMYFVGRVDEQLKIRGYRVEPAEIEAQICKVPGIDSGIVLANNDVSGQQKLIGFYTTNSETIDSKEIKAHLKKSLPAYMIPDLLVAVEHIPLTTNGKTDKRALLKHTNNQHINMKYEKSLPATDIEKYVFTLWEKVLGINNFGVTDDFFEIGGHSLKAVALMAELKKEKGIKLPLASLIQHATVQKFAALIANDIKQESWNCLVPIRTEGTKTPIFLIHGAWLNILLYKSLATYLKPDRPIYAFQASGLDGSKPLKSSINEMATEYIEELERAQPTGSYILMGFSLGGFIAYEMSQQLQQKGKKVKFTGLIDSVSYLAHYQSSNIEKMMINFKSFLVRPFYLLWLFLKEPINEKRRFIALKNKSFRLSIQYRLIKTGIIKQRNIGNEVEQLSFLSDNVMIAMNENLQKYVLKPADFPIDLFKAGKATFYIYERKYYGWVKFAKQGIRVHTIQSEHSKLFASPHDSEFAAIVEHRLAEIEQDELDKTE